ncbi:MAG: TauD/TfdA family dioxygenase [Burkholderiaceae bacterium]|jgi:taurine dioxygenase|nr:TauD/TfdA family dioxygenase [Burkholderiales bacterium]MCZ8102662.1 TauD/TfdA family dioxygenase [Burkholderiales bacterium]MCZ8339077.1 TauD/TfdA family dioxygenase [Burkholderiaceae bacterium]
MHALEAPVGEAGSAVDHGPFRAAPLSPAIGARIEGPRLTELDARGVQALRDALWRYGVLFVPGQHLDHHEHKRVAAWFGDALEVHAHGRTLAEQGHPEVLVIQKSPEAGRATTTDVWHHDVTGREHPNLASVLQAEHVPFGADTMWASTAAAFERLPFALKLAYLNLDVDHDTLYGLLRHGQIRSGARIERIAAQQERATHPAVIRHPFNGRLCLFVGNAWSRRVRDCTAEQGEALMRLANDMSRVPELQVRWAWRRGDVAIWDNLATAHYGVSGDAGAERLLYRVSAWSPSVRPALDRERAVRELMEAGA